MTQGMYLFAITKKTMNVLPPHHTFGSTVNFVGHFSQGSEVYISSGLKYIADEIKEQQPSHLVLVPLFVETLYKKMWQAAQKSGRAQILRAMIKVSNFLRKLGIDLRSKLFKACWTHLVGSGSDHMRRRLPGPEIIDTFGWKKQRRRTNTRIGSKNQRSR